MKIYNVAVYALNSEKDFEYIDRIILSKERRVYREIATNEVVNIVKSNKDIEKLPELSLVVPKSSINRRNKIDNFMLDICVLDYARKFMYSKFIRYMRKDMKKSVSTGEINDNLINVLQKRIKIKMEKDYYEKYI